MVAILIALIRIISMVGILIALIRIISMVAKLVAPTRILRSPSSTTPEPLADCYCFFRV